MKFRGSYSRYRTYSHTDNADAIREVLQQGEMHVARHHQVPQIRKIPTSNHQCGPQMIANAPVRSLTPPSANTGHHRAVSYVSPVMNPDIGQHGRGIITCGPSRFAIPSDPETRETIGIT